MSLCHRHHETDPFYDFHKYLYLHFKNHPWRFTAILSPKLPVEFLQARTATQQTADVELHLHGRTKRAKPRVPAAPLQTKQTSNAPRCAGADPQSRNWSGPAVMMTTPERKRIRYP
ncbi:hypothetical protein CIHG_03425 [Coccidioides immitis H538.4]|uniref:Uncharacterized protein n=1 Tax=Coccidioides immitis H538.4 TaxID=396776 RepID=A0A0J8RMS9_COCIT|nr:hypothetical protein CIHG_03425 [Coccidioides immitis H538.4]